MRRLVLAALLCTAIPAGAATLTSGQNGNYWCPGNVCAFAATPAAADTAVVQHAVVLDGAGSPAPASPLAVGALNLVAGGSLGLYNGMRLNFAGGLWSGGAVDSNLNGTFGNTGTLDVTGAVPSGRIVLENNGTMRVAAGASIVWGNSGLLANLSTGPAAVLELVDTGRLGGQLTLNNEGTLRKSGPGTSVFNAKLNNLGTSAIRPGAIEVTGGTLAIADANGYDGVLFTPGGNIDVAAGAVFAIRDGGDWKPGSEGPASQVYVTTGSGAGHVRLESGGTLLGVNDLGAARGATLDFDPGVFEWRGGSMTGFGVLNAGEITIAGPDPKLLNGFYLDNAGTIKLQTTLPMAGRLWTLAGGLLEVGDGASVVSGGANPAFIVDGTMRKLAGAGTFTLAQMNLIGSGLVEIDGGHFALTEGGSFYSMQSFTGTLDLRAGATVDAGGVFLVDPNAKVTGVGAINANGAEQHGRIEPGAPFGAIQIAGNRLYQANEATTRIAIGGTAPLTQTAQLQVDGDLYANGSTLRVNFRDGFSPAAGDTFDLVTFGGTLGTGVSYGVVIEGLAPGFQYSLTQTAQKTIRLTALNHVLSLADYMFADSFE